MATKVQTILSAAREIFAKYGYKKTTLEDIGRQVGLNQASLYYYFKNKEMLFLAVIIDDVNTFKERTLQRLAGEQEISRRIKRYFIEKHEFMQSNPFVKQVLDLDVERVPLTMRDQLVQFQDFEFEQVTALIEAGIDAGLYRPMDSQQVASILNKITGGIIFGRINKLFERTGDADQDIVRSELDLALDIFLRGMALHDADIEQAGP